MDEIANAYGRSSISGERYIDKSKVLRALQLQYPDPTKLEVGDVIDLNRLKTDIANLPEKSVRDEILDSDATSYTVQPGDSPSYLARRIGERPEFSSLNQYDSRLIYRAMKNLGYIDYGNEMPTGKVLSFENIKQKAEEISRQPWVDTSWWPSMDDIEADGASEYTVYYRYGDRGEEVARAIKQHYFADAKGQRYLLPIIVSEIEWSSSSSRPFSLRDVVINSKAKLAERLASRTNNERIYDFLYPNQGKSNAHNVDPVNTDYFAP